MQTPKSYVMERGFDRSHPMYQNFKYFFQNPLWNWNIPKNGFSVCPYFWLSVVGRLLKLFMPVFLGIGYICQFLGVILGKPLIAIVEALNRRFDLKLDAPKLIFFSFVTLFLGTFCGAALVVVHSNYIVAGVLYFAIYCITGSFAAAKYKEKHQSCKPWAAFLLGILAVFLSYNHIYEWCIFSKIAGVFVTFGVWLWSCVLGIPAGLMFLASFWPIYSIIAAGSVVLYIVGYLTDKYILQGDLIDYSPIYIYKLEQNDRVKNTVRDHYWEIKDSYVVPYLAKFVFSKVAAEYAKKKYSEANLEEIIKLFVNVEYSSYELSSKVRQEFRSSEFYKEAIEYSRIVNEKKKLRQERTNARCEAFWNWYKNNVAVYFSAFWHSIKGFKQGICPYVQFKGEDKE